MTNPALDPLALREVFHLEFLRRLGGRLDPKSYAVKGGVNLRLFFGSVRYSEDLDLDVAAVPVDRLKDTVLTVLRARAFADTLAAYGIREVRPPDLIRAKQTETTQRFKVHLLTAAREDLFTKIEISRRGLRSGALVELVPDAVLRGYRMAPLWIPHYGLVAAIAQKAEALAGRAAVQARDIFDLHILISSAEAPPSPAVAPGRGVLRKARERLFEVEFGVFRDTVLSYLLPEDRAAYDRPEAWDALRLRVAEFLERPGEPHA
ncbi:MAG: nucleotidyl transferase AbiEii/AbiGii toxin family protein [Candidatus Aminicenantes bacterium]|nr:nucleotidyl transferase AbiEii/AbiGii toxin family protein [Candidatus Aminicenantes bacterium]